MLGANAELAVACVLRSLSLAGDKTFWCHSVTNVYNQFEPGRGDASNKGKIRLSHCESEETHASEAQAEKTSVISLCVANQLAT